MSLDLTIENELDAIHSVTFDELVDYLTTIEATGKCEACGNFGWSINLKSGGKPGISEIRSLDTPDMILAFVLMCKKCGNLRTSSAKFVAKKIIESRASKS
ncbi:hypothetical protein [Pseudomonas sp. OV546]|uniref:hypothetical protein n=1 Tax=Pseudomonas sp. OV546 TaxID=1881063 RepID=UPI0011148548|nr:hypothetical protein [Pseudomonas sp. OV546]